MSGFVLEAAGVQWTAPDGNKVLLGVSFGLAAGELVWLSGPSGGGKSTLLRLLGRLISPSTGDIILNGRSMTEWKSWDFRRQAVLVGQIPAVLGQTVRRNLLAPFSYRVSRNNTPPTPEKISAELGLLGFGDIGLDRDVQGLSVGQLQRLCLCRALLLGPAVLLLDEPLAPLDPEAADLVVNRLSQYVDQGGAVLMVSHQRPAKSARHLVLAEGKMEDRQ